MGVLTLVLTRVDTVKAGASRHTTTPTTVRLSVLALFIALPAAAYAAVYPRKPQDSCSATRQPCNQDQDCCDGLRCNQAFAGIGGEFSKCSFAHN
ncbi:hypothetical protein BJV77DRAFT_1038907 [Russula vinacea]|nr:hypothetical protein BJV77DRAFT_1038907 [Russula vinacea]